MKRSSAWLRTRSRRDSSSTTNRSARCSGASRSRKAASATRRSTRRTTARIWRSISWHLLARHDEHSGRPLIVPAVEQAHAAPRIAECLVDRFFPEELVIEQPRVLLGRFVLHLPAKSEHGWYTLLRCCDREPGVGSLATR